MLGLIGRMFLLRFLPRRLVPFLTAFELFGFVRGRRSSQQVATGGRARVGR